MNEYFHKLSREDRSVLTLDSYLKSCGSPTPLITMKLMLEKGKYELEQGSWWEWFAHFDELDNQEPYRMLASDYKRDDIVWSDDDIEEHWCSSSEEELVEESEDDLEDSWEFL